MTGFRLSDAANLAIHALVYLAGQQASDPVPTGQVARHFDVSEAHLSKVLQRLARTGLVRSVRGPGGGFVLAAKPADITLLSIYQAIDGALTRPGRCLLGRRRCELKKCVFGDLADQIHRQVREYFARTTLADLSE